MERVNIDLDMDFENDERTLRRLNRRKRGAPEPPRSVRRKKPGAPDPPSVRKCANFRGGKSKRVEGPVDENYMAFLSTCVTQDDFSSSPDVGGHWDDDEQYRKGLRFLIPGQHSYVLWTIGENGRPLTVTYENDDDDDADLCEDQAKRKQCWNVRDGPEGCGAEQQHVLDNPLANQKREDLKSSKAPSKTVKGTEKEKKLAGEKAIDLAPRGKIACPGSTSSKPKWIESVAGHLDESYMVYLRQILDGKQVERNGLPGDVKNTSKKSVGGEGPSMPKLSDNVHMKQKLDVKQGERPRIFRDEAKGATGSLTAKASGSHPLSADVQKEEKLDGKKGERAQFCRDEVKCATRSLVAKAIESHPLNANVQERGKLDGKHGDILGPSPGTENDVKHNAASQVNKTATGKRKSPRLTHPRPTADDKQGKKHRLSQDSENCMDSVVASKVTLEGTNQHASSINKSSEGINCANIDSPSGLRHGRSGLKDNSEEDVDYRCFLKHMIEYNGCLVYKSEGSFQVIYEHDATQESSSDSDTNSDSLIIIGDCEKDLLDGKYRSLVPRKSYFQDLEINEGRASNVRCTYTKELMDILCKPYMLKEHQELFKEASIRRPLEGRRDFRRGREVVYELEELGKSYLDHHKDVREAYEAAKGDKLKQLNILRGFLFWLKNLAQEGSFRPWQDRACLELTLGSRKH